MTEELKTQTHFNLMNKLRYYKRLMEMGELTEKQQKKYDLYSAQFQGLEPMETKTKLTPEEYKERNKQNEINRYHRLKNNEEFRQKQN